MKNQLTVFMLLFLVTSFAFSQNTSSLDAPIPVDPNVKIGKLSNGLTYYIRNNGKPEDKVELRLVVNAGSILAVSYTHLTLPTIYSV